MLIKKDIVFSGDVINSTARIQSLCNTLGQKLVISDERLRHLDLGDYYKFDEIGAI